MENEEEKGYLPVDPDIDLDVKSEEPLNDEKLSNVEEALNIKKVFNAEEPSDVIKQEENSVEKPENLVEPVKENIHLPSFVPEEDIIMGNDYPVTKENNIKSVRTGGKKKILVAVVLIMLVAVAYIYYPRPEAQQAVNTNQENPNDVIVKSSLEKMRGVKTFNYDGKVDFSYDAKKDGSVTGYKEEDISSINLVNNGVVDYKNWGTPSYYSLLTLDWSDGSSMGESEIFKTNIKLKTEMVYLDGVFYFKPDTIHVESFLTDEMGADIKNFWQLIRHDWFFVPKENNADFYNRTVKGIFPLDGEFSSDNITKINEIISGSDLLKFSKDLGDDKVGEVDTYHYQMKLDDSKGFDLAVELIKGGLRAQGGEDKVKAFEESLKGQAEKTAETKEFVDFILNETDVEVWIGKNDSFIYRIKIDGKFDEASMNSIRDKYRAIKDEKDKSENGEATGMILSFNLDYTLSNFNTAAVRKPENARDVYKIGKVFDYQGKNNVAADNLDTDGDGLSDKLETFFGSDIKKIDADGDGYKDGEEIGNGYDPTIAGSAKLDYDKLGDSLK